MKKTLLIVTVIGLFLLVGTARMTAQDGVGPNDEENDHAIFLPLVSQGAIQVESADTSLNAQGGGTSLFPAPDTPSLLSTASIEKDDIARAATQDSSINELKAVSIIVTFEDSVDMDQLETVSGGQVVHRFEKVFNGASLVLPEEKIDTVAAVEGVTGIYIDELQQLNTDVSPGFIGAPTIWNELGGQGSAGEDVIVGVLDSGVWPEHPAYADPDPSGKPYSAPPVIPGANGFGDGAPRSTCNFGNTAFNPNDAPFACNNKLIGAYAFIDTYKAIRSLLPTEFDSARDDNGHGTHTSSTAAGNSGVAASIFGLPRGIVSGVAPRAHIIMYKVCGDAGCFQSDSIAAIEQALRDGVNVINFSISGGLNAYADLVELTFLRAYENGVFVAASAGNTGPAPNSIDHRGPWVTTVAASTANRYFLSTVTLTADNGDTQTLTGASVTGGISTPTPVVFPPAGQELCLSSFAPGVFSGQLVICQRGVISRVAKSFNVAAGGASGMLLYNPTLQGIATDNHFIPTVHLENDAGQDLLNFMATHTGVTATFTQGAVSPAQGDVMAVFSSRGGPGQTLGISKPDITAPGVQILAGHTPLPATVNGGLPGQLFQAIEGTSMSSPHIAGAAALLKALHPGWTPGQIKSALMLTAFTEGVTKEDGMTPADPFDDGSGRVDLTKAGSAGLTIDETAANYRTLQDELWNANYPSLYVPVMPGQITVQRTVHNETDLPRNWKLEVSAPPDVTVTVPKHVEVPANSDTSFEIMVDARLVPQGEVRHANIQFKQGNQNLHFPITIVRGQPEVTLSKSCAPAILKRGETTECTIAMTNNSFDDAAVSFVDQLPRELKLISGSVVGADENGNDITFSGTLVGVQPPFVSVAVDPAALPFGYIPLSGFGRTINVGATNESIANFTIPSFTYAGETYNRIGIVSNGYIVVGGGTGADVKSINTNLPNPAVPNNLLAPFWTDLNPSAGGRVLINVLTNGADVWTVVEWESVKNFNDGRANTFQAWIGTNSDAHPGEDVSFVYGPNVSNGNSGFLTVGAENKFGNSGGTVYFNGVGTAPAPSTTGYKVDVASAPSVPGETRTITFTAEGDKKGAWTNCAEMTSDLYQGINIACFSGEVTQ